MEVQIKSRVGNLHELTMLVFGVGGCGVQVVKSMTGGWTERFKGYLLDTDPQMLGGDFDAEPIHLNSRATQGMSCAGDVAAGRRALNENREQLSELCSMADIIFVAAGFGGGTGTGGANALVEIASDAGALVIGFVAMPFDFEGAERRAIAKDGLLQFQDAADGVVLVENQRLLPWASDKTSIESAFEVVAETVSKDIRAMQRLLASPGVVNIDFADVRRAVMNSHGLCTMVCGQASGKGRAEQAVKGVLDHPLFCSRAVLAKASSVIVGICGGRDLTLREIDIIMTSLGEVLGEHARIKMGTSVDSTIKDEVSLIVLASESREAGADACMEQRESLVVPGAGEKMSGGKKKVRPVQSSLNLDAPGKGRFKDVEPTLRNGEDLDTPTFMRRGIKLRS
ncbi:MAG: hypothetical protein PHP44_02555 [Kiritimatiellae bacterium]|nr:hypothetical protein [Kiritimatiellia bacterium]